MKKILATLMLAALATAAERPRSAGLVGWTPMGGAVLTPQEDGSTLLYCPAGIRRPPASINTICGITLPLDLSGTPLIVSIQPALGPAGGNLVIGTWDSGSSTLWGFQNALNPVSEDGKAGAYWSGSMLTWQPSARTSALAPGLPSSTTAFFRITATASDILVYYSAESKIWYGLTGSAYFNGHARIAASDYFIGTETGQEPINVFIR